MSEPTLWKPEDIPVAAVAAYGTAWQAEHDRLLTLPMAERIAGLRTRAGLAAALGTPELRALRDRDTSGHAPGCEPDPLHPGWWLVDPACTLEHSKGLPAELLPQASETEAEEFEAWLRQGMDRGWVGPPVCSTHDGIPTTAAEDEEFEEGDPCIHVIRPYTDRAEQAAVEDNHEASVWRRNR